MGSKHTLIKEHFSYNGGCGVNSLVMDVSKVAM